MGERSLLMAMALMGAVHWSSMIKSYTIGGSN